MQFSPKKTERYLSGLRNFIHKRINNYGINKKRLCFIQRLYVCSALYKNAVPISTDITLFIKVFLVSAQAELFSLGRDFQFDIRGNAICEVDRNRLSTFLLEIARNTQRVNITVATDGIRIYFVGKAPQKRLQAIIKAFGGTLLHINRKHIYAVFVPMLPSAESPQKITGAVELLTDPLSVVKIFIH